MIQSKIDAICRYIRSNEESKMVYEINEYLLHLFIFIILDIDE